MGSSTGFTTGRQVKLYYKETFAQAAPSYAQITAAGAGVVLPANEVEEVRDIGDVEQSANNIEFGVYGEDTQKKIAGQASLGDFTFTFALQNNNTIHDSLAGATIGDSINLGIETVTGSTEKTIDFIRGTIGGVSKSTPLDETAQVTVTVAMEQKPIRINQA